MTDEPRRQSARARVVSAMAFLGASDLEALAEAAEGMARDGATRPPMPPVPLAGTRRERESEPPGLHDVSVRLRGGR